MRVLKRHKVVARADCDCGSQHQIRMIWRARRPRREILTFERSRCPSDAFSQPALSVQSVNVCRRSGTSLHVRHSKDARNASEDSNLNALEAQTNRRYRQLALPGLILERVGYQCPADAAYNKPTQQWSAQCRALQRVAHQLAVKLYAESSQK